MAEASLHRIWCRLPLAAAFFGLCVLLSLAADDARAAWRDDIGAFRVLFMVDDDLEKALEAHEPFRQGLQDTLGMPVEVRPETSLRRVILAMADRPAEYMILPASAYAAIWLECECVEPLAIAKTAAGADAVQGLLIVREDSAIQGIEQLAGRKVYGLSRYSLAGYRMARHAIEGAAAADAKTQDAAIWQFEDDAETALMKFAAGEGDAIAGFENVAGADGRALGGTLDRLKTLTGGNGRFRVIWRSAQIPNTVHAIRKNLDGEAKRLLRSYTVGLETRDALTYDLLEADFAGGFVAARQSQFDGLIDFFREFRTDPQADGETSDASMDATGAIARPDSDEKR